ncbi:ArsR family transcriptional regulator [Microbacterium sp. AG157]|uniref:Putative transcriptional regulator, ArsR family protein n=2 Tax=Microbacteriaceae TaxID=85023 RepID=A0A4Y3QJ31_MICTE|nr:ArsR family transcriptional regulator [Microbacterium sp. AG157]GEB44877.1 putative transcriptional regulator, ArsR family protein [Microbacterium testaceum]
MMDAMTPGIALPLLDAPCCVSSGDAAMAPAEAETLAKTLKALADPARLRIVSIIAAHDAGATCACDLQEPLGLSQPTVSHHTKVLVDAGILTREKRGTWAYFSLVPGALDSVAAAIAPRR